MQRPEKREDGATRRAAGALLGGLLALGVEVVILLAGAVAISNGILREDAGLQLTAAACVVGGAAGGWLACSWWKTRKLLAGLASGAVCFLLILAVGAMSGDGPSLGAQACLELAGCLCGGALSGLLHRGRRGKKKRGAKGR